MDEATLVVAPPPVRTEELLPEHLPTAWTAEGTTTLAALGSALAQARHGAVPWVLLCRGAPPDAVPATR